MPHTTASLVKYCSVETALKILNSGKLRWSAPSLFGDPFELSHRTEPNVNAETLLDALVHQVVVMLFGPEEPVARGSRLLATIKRWREERRFADEAEAVGVLRDLLGQLAQAQARLNDNYLSEWRQFTRRLRIACFSDHHNILDCWERYADRHRGVALRFAAGEGNLLARPRLVHYSRKAPVVTNLKEQLDVMFGHQLPPTPGEFTDKFLVKSRHLQREAEWRCFAFEDQDEEVDESLWYHDQPLPAAELGSVYLGVNLSLAHKNQLVTLLRQRYPQTRILQAEPVPERFELNFTSLGSA